MSIYPSFLVIPSEVQKKDRKLLPNDRIWYVTDLERGLESFLKIFTEYDLSLQSRNKLENYGKFMSDPMNLFISHHVDYLDDGNDNWETRELQDPVLQDYALVMMGKKMMPNVGIMGFFVHVCSTRIRGCFVDWSFLSYFFGLSCGKSLIIAYTKLFLELREFVKMF